MLYEKNSLKKTVLTTVMEYEMVASSTLKLLSDKSEYIRKVITKLVAEDYLTTKKISIKSGRVSHVIEYKQITNKGMQWLKDNSAPSEWTYYIPVKMPKFAKRTATNKDGKCRFLKNVTASIIFACMNIDVYNPKAHVVPPVIASYEDMIIAAKNECYVNNNEPVIEPLTESLSASIYYSSKFLKESFLLTNEDIKQHLFSNHTGLLVYNNKAYLIYVSTASGIALRKQVIEKTKIYVRSYLINDERITNKLEPCKDGIVFCKNAQEFKKIIEVNKDRGKDIIDKLLLHSMNIIPITRKGVYQLVDILMWDRQLHERALTEIKEKDKGFTVHPHPVVYELQYYGRDVFLGFDMNLVELIRLDAEISVHEEEKPIILCYEWQKEYYEKVFGTKADYYLMPYDFIPYAF